MSECRHGLDEAWCATCKHGPERDEPWRPATTGAGDHATTTAKYEATCPGGCGDMISAGDRITLQRRGDERRWVCEACT